MAYYPYNNTLQGFTFRLMDGTECFKDVPVIYSYDYQEAEDETMFYPGCDEDIAIIEAKLDPEYKDDYSVNEKRAIREYLESDAFKEDVYNWMQEAKEKAMLY